MPKRYVTIWFPHLQTDWFSIREPKLREQPFVIATPDHGRMVITAANMLALEKGIELGNVVADAKVIIPFLHVMDEKPGLSIQLLKKIAEWCIRYTPAIAIDPPDGLILDVSGCAHLWGGEKQYLTEIIKRFRSLGYHVRGGMADSIGAAWAISRFGQHSSIVKSGEQRMAIFTLSPAALRLESETVQRLQKLGLRHISDFINMPRSVLFRRFGQHFITRLNQALNCEEEGMELVHPVEPYQERLPCLEPIVTATGIEIALQRLLETLCHRLCQEEKGLRIATFKCYRVDGKIELIEIGTNLPSYNTTHLFKLFEIKIGTIEPALGIELFILEAKNVEDVLPLQQKLWDSASGLYDPGLAELLDRFAGKFGDNHIHRYLPDEHYWPERSIKPAASLQEKLSSSWKMERPRPLQLLSKPEPIEVTAPIPDYPPMLFRHNGNLHKIIRADGPERIEQEWWLQQGQHRDYYYVEDEEGHRYWLFRSGHYDAEKSYGWFLHGFFS